MAPPAGSRAAEPNQQANFGAGKASIVVDDRGTLYTAWPSNTANQTALSPPGYFLSKSTDKGGTWTVTQIAPFSHSNRAGARAFLVRMAWSPSGSEVAGPDKPEVANLSHVFYYRSADGPKPWPPPR